MLKIPSFRKIGDVTVYQDDTVWYQFCLVPALPTISRDRDDNPIFLLTTFQTTEQDDSGSQNASVGGGFMNLDVQFAVDEATTAAARAELQQWVNEEYARRRSDSQYAALSDYQSPNAPQVLLADPLYSGGTVKMLTTQSEVLTTDRIAEAPASLVSGSTAVFNIDLTAAGASFMKKLMVNPDGSGKIDLTPVSVLYCLNMLARMPAVKINIVGDSTRIHETLLELSANNQDNPCTPSEVESYRETSTNTSTLKETGMVKVHIDKGDFSVPDEVLKELQDYAFELFDTMVQERFLVPAEGGDRPLEFEDEFPGSDSLDPGWAAILYQGANYSGASLEVRDDLSSLGHLNGQVSSVRVRAGHRITLYRSTQFQGASQQFSGSVSSLGGGWNDCTASVKVWRPPSSRYKVQKTVNHATMNLEVALERSQVVEWPVVAQATLQTFFANATKEAMQRHVVHLTLDDFKTLGVKVRTFVQFEKEPIQAIAVQTEYITKDDTDKTGAWTLTAADPGPKTFNPAVVGNQRDYRYRYQVIYDDGTTTDYTAWTTTSDRNLNISVPDPGRLELETSAASLNWDLVKSVVVRLAYGDAASGIQPVTKTFQLTPQTPNRKWEERFKAQVQGSVEVKLTYHMADEKVFEAKPQAVAVTETLFVVPPPQVDILNINLVPAGDWSAVSQVVVSLEYDVGQGRIYDKVYRLTKLTDSAEWQVLLQDPNRRSFRYKYLVIYKDGRSEDIAWQTKTGDQPISIQVKGLPVLRVGVNVSGFEGMAAAVVKFTYGGETSTITFTEAGIKGWEMPRLPSGDTQYTYEVTWYPQNGDPISAVPVVTQLTELVLQPPRQPKAGKLDVMIRGFAVNFEVTPFVDVMLRWSDGQRQEQHMVFLHKAETMGKWSVDIGPSNQRQYHYDIIYNLADGSRVNGPSVDTEVPVISVMPYRPSA